MTTKKEDREAFEPVAWVCDRDGDTELPYPFFATNPKYVKQHKNCNWTPLYLHAAPKQQAVDESPIYYMRDNHTFKRLSSSVSAAIVEIEAELNAGYTHGMLCSKRSGFKDIHASGDTSRMAFLAECRAALLAAIPGKTEVDDVRHALWKVLDALGALGKPWELESHGFSRDDAERIIALASHPIPEAPTMANGVELLPLPWSDVQPNGRRWLFNPEDRPRVEDYARASIAHATAAKDAEIKALQNRLDISEINERDYRQLSLEAEARAERLEAALVGLKNLMMKQVKWEPCDCGCPQQRKPDGPHSVTWLRAAYQVDIAIEKLNEG